MRENVKPRVVIEPAIHVWIQVERTVAEMASLRLVPDDGTILRFLEWQMTAEVYPLRGTGSSGPGFYSGYFDVEDEQVLREYFGQ